MADEVLEIEARLKDFISGNLKTIENNIKVFSEKNIASFKKTSETANSSGKSIGFLTSKIGALGSAYLTLSSAGKVINYFGKTTEEFLKQEEAVTRLSAVLKQNEIYVNNAEKYYTDFASSMQDVTIYADDNILSVQRLMMQYGLFGEETNNATKAAMELASSLGMDLQSAGELIAKTIGSDTNALSRYGVEVSGAVGSTERLNSTIKNISEKFGGSATAAASTYSGQLARMKNRTSDLQEAIGKELLPIQIVWNEAILQGTKYLSEFVTWMTKSKFVSPDRKKQLEDEKKMYEQNIKDIKEHRVITNDAEAQVRAYQVSIRMVNEELGILAEKQKAEPLKPKKRTSATKGDTKKEDTTYITGFAPEDEIDRRWKAKQKAVLDDISLMQEQADWIDQLAVLEKQKAKEREEAERKATEDRWNTAGNFIAASREIVTAYKDDSPAMFALSKGLAMGESIMNTAKAVTAALPNIPLAVSIGLLGAAQTAIIAKTSFSAKATGDENVIGGQYMAGEHGPELITLPRGSKINNNRETRNITNNNYNQPAVVVLQGNEKNLIKEIEKATRNKSFPWKKLLAQAQVYR